MSNKLSMLQYILMIHGVQMGVGVLMLPHELAHQAGTDGWISIIFGWVITTIASLVIIQVMKRYPDGTIIDLLTHYFGRWVGEWARSYLRYIMRP